MVRPVHESFHWSECARVLEAHAAEGELELDEARRAFVREDLRVVLPLVLPVPPGCRSLVQYVAGLPDEPGRHVLVLMQAGAVSMGLFEAGEPLLTKTSKRYVVRGKGRAQPLQLATKGKSRYGSRLRLQNALKLLEETNERLREWYAHEGPVEQLFYNAPVRLWASLFQVRPAPPFERSDRLVRVPLDLPRPTTDVLLRTYRGMGYGRVVREPRTRGS